MLLLYLVFIYFKFLRVWKEIKNQFQAMKYIVITLIDFYI